MRLGVILDFRHFDFRHYYNLFFFAIIKCWFNKTKFAQKVDQNFWSRLRAQNKSRDDFRKLQWSRCGEVE